jgi:hypothetical protein
VSGPAAIETLLSGERQAVPALGRLSPASSPSPADAPTQLERVSAYTQPSVVYIGITWTGWVYDSYNKQYLNDGKPFEEHSQCTGYVVNPAGYIATAGHCVDPNEVTAAFFQQGAQWAIANDYYENSFTVNELLAFNDYRVRNSEKKNGPDRKVTVEWSVSAGGVETGRALPARVVKWQKITDDFPPLLDVLPEEPPRPGADR